MKSRLLPLVLGLIFAAAASAQTPAAAPDAASAVAPVQSLCDALLASMKKGAAMDFAERKAFLAPIITADFDLPFMTRIVVGLPWRSMSAADRAALVQAFSDNSIATYATRFKSYGGEHFEVDPHPAPAPTGNNLLIVKTKLFTGGEPVELDYVEHQTGGHWKIIDIYLNGTISELAANRSDYAATLRSGGAPALIQLLHQKSLDVGH